MNDAIKMTDTQLKNLYSDCTLCPRRCHVNRYTHTGFCGAGTKIKLARAALHMWEEPVIGGSPDDKSQPGSGAIFFSNCNLKCVFCQNYSISSEGFGKDVSIDRLAEIMLALQEQGAANIDLVTATHYLPSIIIALDHVKDQLHIPVVYNCGGYETVESVRMLDGYVDIYLPDLKYFSDDLAVRYSSAPGYFNIAIDAIAEMIRQTGAPYFNGSFLKKGVIIRHMVLPGCRHDSMEMLTALVEQLSTKNIGTDYYLISLMSQYTPFYKAAEFKGMNRRITSFEYDSVVNHALQLGLNGFMQQKSSAKEEYTPSFNLEGV